MISLCSSSQPPPPPPPFFLKNISWIENFYLPSLFFFFFLKRGGEATGEKLNNEKKRGGGGGGFELTVWQSSFRRATIICFWKLLILFFGCDLAWFRVDNHLYYWLSVILGIFVPIEDFSLIWRRHHYRWWAANFDQCSVRMVIERWGFFSVPHLLWNGTSVYIVHLRFQHYILK